MSVLNDRKVTQYDPLSDTDTLVATETKQDTIIGHLENIVGMAIPEYDYASVSYNDGTFTDTYVFKSGGSGGSTVSTVVIVYTDATRQRISTVTKT